MANGVYKTASVRLTDRYCITGELGRGAMGEVHRAFPFEDPSREVAIKIIQRNRKLGPNDLLRFQKEAALMSQLHHQNIISFHELGIFESDNEESSNSGYYIVMEYARGSNLRDSLERDGRKELPFFFQVGLQVVDALDYTHGKNIIHRDIKPHNIIVTQSGGDDHGVHVKVLDFGVARLAEAIQVNINGDSSTSSGEEKAGTPLYMAPEIVNNSFGPVDHRVDLYSLGCVLYEILTGHPPFHGSSRDALEKAHQNDEPQQLINLRPDVPNAVALIVHKLLAKRAEDRYQTAFALQADLLRAKMLYDQYARRMPVWTLGLKDRLFAVSAQLPMVGREKDVKILKDEYEKVNAPSGRSRMTVISGISGVGKTRLLSELKSELTQAKIKFIQGLFTQHENTLPFNALANAFNEILMRTIKSGGIEADELAKKIRTVVGSDAHLVATIVPGLRPFLGDLTNADVPTKVTDDNFTRFAKAFSDFVRCLVPENQPLVFIFDDLHWADDKSLELVDQFFSNANSLKFHLVLTYQVDSTKLTSRFRLFIEKFRQLRRRFSEISLDVLSMEDVANLCKVVLRESDRMPKDFVEFVHTRSRGVPMLAVEIVRRLVSMDVIRLGGRNLQWEYDVDSLKRTPINLHAIDIALGRVADYREDEQAILKVAAVAGQTFYYEMLLLGDRNPGAKVLKVMEKALDEGLIVRSSEDAAMSHLGKAFSFSHIKVRDAVYSLMDEFEVRQLHRLMAECLRELVSKPKEAQLFAITHHLNISANDQNPDFSLDTLRLSYNVQSGDTARKTSSPQAAEKFYELALSILSKWSDRFTQADLKVSIVERIADVYASQKKYGLALSRYKELMTMPMSIERKTAIAARTVGFQMVGGLITDALNLMHGVLRRLGRPLPAATTLNLAISWFWVTWDMLDFRRENRLVKGLRGSFKSYTKHGERTERMYPSAKLYHLASILHRRNDEKTSYIALDLGLKELVLGKAPISTAIKLVADRAAMLASLGGVKSAYRLFDLCAEIARRAKFERAYGYTLLRRAESVDYIKGRHEDISDNIRAAWINLSPREDRLAFATIITFKQYRELLKCNFHGVVSLGSLMPDTVQTRNWNSQVSIALTLYSSLLQGRRNKIVDDGTRFMRRREEVSARLDDIFSQIVMAMLTFARGETDPARAAFDNVIKHWVGAGNRREGLSHWQEDFVGLFICTYPILFEQEYGRQLMKNTEMSSLLQVVHGRGIISFRHRRTIQHLLWARTNELLGKGEVSRNYDAALRSAKESGNNLVQTLCYMWLGLYLVDHGQSQKKDYLRRAHMHSNRNQMDGLTSWIIKSAEKRKVGLVKDSVAQGVKQANSSSSIADALPVIATEILELVSREIDLDSNLEDCLPAAMAILAKHHPGRVIMFMASVDDQARCLYPETPPSDVQRIHDTLSLYFNLRSTLTMHLYHAAWLHEVGLESTLARSRTDFGQMDESMKSTMVEPTNRDKFSADATEVLDPIMAVHEGAILSMQGDVPNSQRSGVAGARDVSGMFAIVPVRSSGETVAVILIEELGAQYASDLNSTRRELDLFGVHLGSLIASKVSRDVIFAKRSGQGIIPHTHGAMYAEACDWLEIRFVGQMRTGREASWYLGLSWGQDHYVVAYCCIRGESKARDHFSAQVFRQLFAVRELSVMTGKNAIEVGELRAELGGLFSKTELTGQMDEILFAFSIFDRSKSIVTSGHFGGARPLVVATENKVEAFNQVAVQLRDGRDVRYWEVRANFSDEGLYLLSFDTSKLKNHAEDAYTNRRSVAGSSVRESISATKKYLETAMARNELPRYYLAVTRKFDEAQSEQGQDEKDAPNPPLARPA